MIDLTKLKEIRRQKKLKIYQVAKQSGLNKDTVSAIENGVGRPSLHSVEKVVIALGLRIEIML